MAASSGWDNTIQVWDVTTEARVQQTLRDPNHVDTAFFGIEWSPDGKVLASGSYQQEVQVWDVSPGTRRWVGRGQPTTIRRVAWSPDGTRLASGGYDGSIILWEAATGTQQARLQGHRGMVLCVAWSPDGTRLASGGGGEEVDRTLRLGCTPWRTLLRLEGAEPDRVCAGVDSDRPDAGQWGQ